MSTFLNDLWTSVFTPGTTPTLVLATNATFAALQLVLFSLLVATYSIHFLILSVLCAGLWGSINWFVVELGRANEEEGKRGGKDGGDAGARASRGTGARGGESTAAVSVDEAESMAKQRMESETKRAQGGGGGGGGAGGTLMGQRIMNASTVDDFGARHEETRRDLLDQGASSGQRSGNASSTGVVRDLGASESGNRQRRTGAGMDMSGELSTDSEWEKVEGER